MPKSKRHHPRLKRKTHRKYRGGAPLAIAPKFIDRTTQKGCSSGGWFSSATPKGCTTSETVIKSVTAFYNESVVNAKNPLDYVESKRWLKEILSQYISGQGPFPDSAQQSYGQSQQPQYGQQPFGPSLSRSGTYPLTSGSAAMPYNDPSSGYGSSGYSNSSYGSMGSSGYAPGSSGYSSNISSSSAPFGSSNSMMYGGLPKK